MPNVRGKKQRLVNFPASEEFIQRMDEAWQASGFSSRSEFVRLAIVEAAQARGIAIPKTLAAAPSRLRRSAAKARG